MRTLTRSQGLAPADYTKEEEFVHVRAHIAKSLQLVGQEAALLWLAT